MREGYPFEQSIPVDRRIRLSRIRVLVADRDPRTASLVRRVLYNFGFRLTDVARDGRQALDMLSLAHYDLLITEYDLDYNDGPELVRRVRTWSKDDTVSRDMPIKTLSYVAQFLTGVAHSARDDMLENAARHLASEQAAGRPVGSDAARIAGLVQDRLHGAEVI